MSDEEKPVGKRAKEILDKLDEIKKGSEQPTTEEPLVQIPRLLWKVFTHPFTAIVVAVILAIVVYILTTAEREPVFTISPPELIAQTMSGQEKLKILWDNKQLQNVSSTKIAIWNKGSRYIDKEDISSTDPIRIEPLEKVDILAIQVLKTSRPTLRFSSIIESDTENLESVLIGIEGDEALEKWDGALFHILYSGSIECGWRVKGRIKGAPEGFRQTAWERIRRPKIYPWHHVMTIFYFLVLIFSIGYVVKGPKTVGWLDSGMIINYILWLIIAGMILLNLIQNYSYLMTPSWLSY